jgi:predicted deacylase
VRRKAVHVDQHKADFKCGTRQFFDVIRIDPFAPQKLAELFGGETETAIGFANKGLGIQTGQVARCDLGIDLHPAAIHRTNLPHVRILPDNAYTAELAEVLGAPVILQSPLREGSLRGAAKEIGKDILLFEAGEGLLFDGDEII